MRNKDILSEGWFGQHRIIAGVMTGTSMDGIDVSIAEFVRNVDKKTNFKLIKHSQFTYPAQLKAKIIEIIDGKSHISGISLVNFYLSKLYADAVIQTVKDAGLLINDLDCIGIHGQTVWHEPKGMEIDGHNITSTLQLGSVSALAQLAGVPVIGNFRAADIALGGQGAPLVPIFDLEFLSDSNENRAILNIGGMANITYLPASDTAKGLKAFDTGPGNVLIDLAMRKFYNKEYDDEGETANKGNLSVSLFNLLKNNEFITMSPPKSTGREFFNREYLDSCLGKIDILNIRYEDVINSITLFTAWSIAENVRLFTPAAKRIIVSGGGSKNKYLIRQLTDALSKIKLSYSDEYRIPSQAKESLCFAYLAYRTAGGLTGNIPAATGARGEVILGEIALV